MAELIVKSKIKELVKNLDPEMRVSPEFYDALEEELKALVASRGPRPREGRPSTPGTSDAPFLSFQSLLLIGT